jgi:glycosyltransferase involved in cell wall biosynthesis
MHPSPSRRRFFTCLLRFDPISSRPVNRRKDVNKYTGSTSLPSISVVVPVYCSEGTLPMLVERLQPVLAAQAREYEVILVSDGSPDRSWEIIEQLAANHQWVRGIRLMRNYGQHNALLAGIRSARFEKIVTMDDDLQHPPEELPKLLAKLAEGFDVVYGAPEQEHHGLLRDLASVITKLALQSAMGAETARLVSAWRAFHTHLRDAFASYHSPFVSIDVLLTWGTTKFGSVRMRHDVRKVGKSNYTFGKLVRHALNMMTGFSVLPLQLASIIGFGFTLFGIGVLLYVVGKYFISGTSVAGFPFLASIIAIFSGAQLFALGIIGEYLARMHFRMMDKPAYAIGECREQPRI